MEHIIEFDDVTFEYEADDKHYNVFSDFSLKIRRGTFNVVLGHNGSGKSTMAKLLCGFEKPGKGNLYLKGLDMADDTIKERAAHIGYVMQNPLL